MEPKTERWLMEILDERQRKEVGFNRIYADDFSHGTDGHNARLIIAKLADKLTEYEAEIDRLRQNGSEVE